MFLGAPLPLPADITLSRLLTLANRAEALGAWVNACAHRVRIYRLPYSRLDIVLASQDLGYLLGRCAHVALREGQHTRVLPSQTVIQWRALQVATATPYLPGIERLRVLFPRLQTTSRGFVVPLLRQSPEEVLARCVGEDVRVASSSIVYCAPAGDANLPVLPPPP